MWLVAEREEGEGDGWEARRQDAERGDDGGNGIKEVPRRF